MQSSNPLIVVGISAAIAIGSATAATAKADSLADTQSTHSSNAINAKADDLDRNLPRSAQSSSEAEQRIERTLLSLVNGIQQEVATVDIELDLTDATSWGSEGQPGFSEGKLAQSPALGDSPESTVEDDSAPEANFEVDTEAVEELGSEATEASEELEDEAIEAIEDEDIGQLEELEELEEQQEQEAPEDVEATEAPEATDDALPSLPENGSDVEAELEAIEEDLPETAAESEAEDGEAIEAVDPDLLQEDLSEEDLSEENAPDLPPDPSTETVEGEIEAQVEEAAPGPSPETVDPATVDPADAPTADPDTEPAPPPTADPGTNLEYLDPDPNPLSFPTDPSEVEIVGTQPITLSEAIELGIRNNEELQRARLELQRSQAALREAEAANFPTVDVGADLTFQGNEQPNVQQNPFTGEQDADGTELQTSLGLGGAIQANYAIFTSGRRSAIIQAAEREVRLQELAVESTTEDLILQVSQAYYDLQAADEQVQIFQAALDEAERSLRDAEALERAGVGTRFDVLQAQVDVANAQQDLRNQLSQQEISRRRLVERLNLSQSVTLAAAEPVEVAGVWDLTLEESIVQAYRNRAELEQQLVQREIAERNRRASLAQLGPQVNLSAQYGVNNTLASDPDSISEDFGFLSSFQVQLGVSLRLFDGGQARAQARQAEANMAIAESQFANLRDQIRLEVEEAYSQLDANFENIQTTALAVQQAEEALRLARLRFQAGVGTQTDVLRSQTELTRSRFNNLQAILNYNRALVALQRAVSNLPEGLLNEVP